MQCLQREARRHFANRKAAAGDVEHREIGVDALDDAKRGERIAAFLQYFELSLGGRMLHGNDDLAAAGGEVHGSFLLEVAVHVDDHVDRSGANHDPAASGATGPTDSVSLAGEGFSSEKAAASSAPRHPQAYHTESGPAAS